MVQPVPHGTLLHVFWNRIPGNKSRRFSQAECTSTQPINSDWKKHIADKAIVDVRLCPCSALPSPPSRPIARITCTQNFPDSYLRLPENPFCRMTLLATEWSFLQRTQQRPLQQRLPMLLNGPDNPKITPSSVGAGLSHGHRHHAQKNWQRSHVWFWRYTRRQTDTQTDTDVLITILCHRYCGRSNNCKITSDAIHHQ